MNKPGGKPLELQNLTKSFGGLIAVDHVSAVFPSGKITGLIGPNGAGKTTIFNLISGFLEPDGGSILLDDDKIEGMPSWRIAQLGVGRLFQDVRVFNKLTALENVLLSMKKQPGENPLRAIFFRKKSFTIESQNRQRAEEWLEFVGLLNQKDTLAENLSYGQQKLLTIARLLNGNFDVFLLDEPTAGVNPKMIEDVLGVIRGLTEKGKTVVITEHNMSVIMENCDWVYFLNEGRVTSFGLPRDVLGDPEVRKAYIGI